VRADERFRQADDVRDRAAFEWWRGLMSSKRQVRTNKREPNRMETIWTGPFTKCAIVRCPLHGPHRTRRGCHWRLPILKLLAK